MRPGSKFRRSPALLLTILITVTLSGYGFLVLHSTGQVGTTLRDGGLGCSCHAFAPSDSVHVWITGPESVAPGGFAEYVITMTGGPAVKGGFNVASSAGVLSAFDTSARLITGELTHSAPKGFQNDTVSWRFRYQAPFGGSRDTLFSVGNSTNGNGIPTGDEYNFGENFTVHLADSTLGVEDQLTSYLSAELAQNYPNPFNRDTRILVNIQTPVFLNVTVFNAVGEKVAVLAEGMAQFGDYILTFDGAMLPSGIYFCRMQAGLEVRVRKMVLAK